MEGHAPIDGQAEANAGGIACSFCGEGAEHVPLLIAGHGAVYICDECVLLAYELVCASVTCRRAAVRSPQPSAPSTASKGDGLVGIS
jgi:hypothetical protein